MQTHSIRENPYKLGNNNGPIVWATILCILKSVFFTWTFIFGPKSPIGDVSAYIAQLHLQNQKRTISISTFCRDSGGRLHHQSRQRRPNTTRVPSCTIITYILTCQPLIISPLLRVALSTHSSSTTPTPPFHITPDFQIQNSLISTSISTSITNIIVKPKHILHINPISYMARSVDPLIVGRVIGDVIDMFVPVTEFSIRYANKQVANGCHIKPSASADKPRVQISTSSYPSDLYTLVSTASLQCKYIYCT